MPIITLSEVKTLLQLTSISTYDTLITALIPLVQKQIINYTNNSFLNIAVQYYGSGLVFTSADRKITIPDSFDFTENYFVAGEYKITGSYLNNGIFEVDTVEAQALTVKNGTTPAVVNEESNVPILITKVEFPEDIKLDVALYINWMMKKQGKDVLSESLPGGYAVTYKNDKDALKPFTRYRKPYA